VLEVNYTPAAAKSRIREYSRAQQWIRADVTTGSASF